MYLHVIPAIWILLGSLTFGQVIVTSPSDQGPGTLREAIQLSESGQTIFFDSGLINQSLIISSAEIMIDKNLTLDGPGFDQGIKIESDGSSRHFNISKMMNRFYRGFV